MKCSRLAPGLLWITCQALRAGELAEFCPTQKIWRNELIHNSETLPGLCIPTAPFLPTPRAREKRLSELETLLRDEGALPLDVILQRAWEDLSEDFWVLVGTQCFGSAETRLWSGTALRKYAVWCTTSSQAASG